MSEEKINLAPFGIAGMVAVFVLAITLIIGTSADASWVFGEKPIHEIAVSGSAALIVAAGYIISSILILMTGTGLMLKTDGPRFWSGLFIVFGMICSLIIVFGLVGDATPGSKMIRGISLLLFGAAVIASAIVDQKAGRTINVAVAMAAVITPLIVLCTSNHATTDVISLTSFMFWLAVESVTFALIPEKVYKDDAVSS